MKPRHLWSIVLGVSFLVSAPLAVLYTAGYQFDFDRARVVRTGTLSVDSRPAGARVLINGIQTEDTTPLRLPRLPPGIYEVTVEKPGYRPWRKLLEVQSARAVLAENITLYPYAVPERVRIGVITHLAVAPDGGAVAFTVKENDRVTIVVRTVDTGGERSFPPVPSALANIDELVWSRDNPGFLEASSGSSTYLLDPQALRTVSATARNSQALPLPAPTIKKALPNRSGTLWLFTDGVEVSLWDPREERTTLLTRVGNGANDLAWNDRGTAIYLAAGGTLTAIELDDRDRRIFTGLATMDEIKKIAPTADGRVIYFSGRIGAEEGLYRLRLR